MSEFKRGQAVQHEDGTRGVVEFRGSDEYYGVRWAETRLTHVAGYIVVIHGGSLTEAAPYMPLQTLLERKDEEAEAAERLIDSVTFRDGAGQVIEEHDLTTGDLWADADEEAVSVPGAAQEAITGSGDGGWTVLVPDVFSEGVWTVIASFPPALLRRCGRGVAEEWHPPGGQLGRHRPVVVRTAGSPDHVHIGRGFLVPKARSVKHTKNLTLGALRVVVPVGDVRLARTVDPVDTDHELLCRLTRDLAVGGCPVDGFQRADGAGIRVGPATPEPTQFVDQLTGQGEGRGSSRPGVQGDRLAVRERDHVVHFHSGDVHRAVAEPDVHGDVCQGQTGVDVHVGGCVGLAACIHAPTIPVASRARQLGDIRKAGPAVANPAFLHLAHLPEPREGRPQAYQRGPIPWDHGTERTYTMTNVAEEASAADRRDRALKLRIRGAHWNEIAKRCGYPSPGAALKDVGEALIDSARRAEESADQLRATLMLSYQALTGEAWDVIDGASSDAPPYDPEGGSAPDERMVKLRAIDEVRRLTEAQSKLSGLDKQREVTETPLRVEIVGVDPEDIV